MWGFRAVRTTTACSLNFVGRVRVSFILPPLSAPCRFVASKPKRKNIPPSKPEVSGRKRWHQNKLTSKADWERKQLSESSPDASRWYVSPKRVQKLRAIREKEKQAERIRLHEKPEGSYVYSPKELEDFKQRIQHIPHHYARATAVGKSISSLADIKEVSALRKKAKSGDRESQLHLGLMYLLGEDVLSVDLGLAKKWLSRAAELGDPDAQYFLGAMYARGLVDSRHDPQSTKPQDPHSVALRDYHEAIRLWNLAALQGHADAMFRLASLMYENEHGKSELVDHQQARQWLETAARQESPLSQVLLMLGSMLLDGKGGPADKPRAAALFERVATEYQDPVGNFSLGLLYYQGEAGLPLDLNTARLHFTKAAEAGLEGAQRMLAEMLRSGEGGPRDEVQAQKWIQQAENQKDSQLPSIEVVSDSIQIPNISPSTS